MRQNADNKKRTFGGIKMRVPSPCFSGVLIWKMGRFLTFVALSWFPLLLWSDGGTWTMPYNSRSVNSSSTLLNITQVGSGRAGLFQVLNTDSGAEAVYALTRGSGSALFGYTTGTGRAGYFLINNVSNSSPALEVRTNGSGSALFANTTGNGYAVYAYTAGNAQAGYFVINNANNSLPALHALTIGTGRAGYFQISNSNNSQSALRAFTNGTGPAGSFENGNNSSSQPALEAKTSSTVEGVAAILGVIASNSPGGYSVGVHGQNSSTGGNGIGVWGSHNGNGWGVYGTTVDGIGVYGYATGDTNQNYGVYGETASTNGYAGYFQGKVHVNGTLSKSGGSFKIDHPLDPANKYLSHSFVESPDMKNVYDGVVVLDANGEAWVALPEWFEALNKEFRYQLTPIGAPAPNLHIAQEIRNNRFKIAGGLPAQKVCWQVTGVRQDPYAERYRIPVEEWKPENERGYYLHPELYGLPPTLGLEARRAAFQQRRR